jgi:hypothetical protein
VQGEKSSYTSQSQSDQGGSKVYSPRSVDRSGSVTCNTAKLGWGGWSDGIFTLFRDFRLFHNEKAVGFKKYLAGQQAQRSCEPHSKSTLHAALVTLQKVTATNVTPADNFMV